MRAALAWIGAVVALMYVLGAFGVGNFVLIYTPEKVTCTKGTT
mgnify:CR=1 FL=1